jgi:XTP/dITP diphosphohydrolase
VTALVLASSNPGKLREFAALLAPLRLELLAQGTLGIPAPAETGSSFLANAVLKARHAAARSGLIALADDSGLEVDALGGRPGVWSARFAGKDASDADNLQRLLLELEDVPDAARQARYQCIIACVHSAADPAPLIASGTWEGHIARTPAGRGGFGYDPVFVPAGETRTAAEFSAGEKNSVSHRAQALKALVAGLAREGYIPAP